jgi:hypothetical protein
MGGEAAPTAAAAGAVAAGSVATGGAQGAAMGFDALLARIGLPGQTGILVLGSAALAAVLLGALLVAQLRPRKKTTTGSVRQGGDTLHRKQGDSAHIDEDDGTQPADMDADGTSPVQDIFARARLELVPDKNERNDTKLREEIRFYARNAGEARQEWKIGRSYEYCDYVIDDPHKRISRLHATIIEENNAFFIRDEGSAGGTYINKRKLTPQIPQQLNDNDLINLNIIAYRFFAGDEMGPGPELGAAVGTESGAGGAASTGLKGRYTPDPEQTEKAENDLF